MPQGIQYAVQASIYILMPNIHQIYTNFRTGQRDANQGRILVKIVGEVEKNVRGGAAV